MHKRWFQDDLDFSRGTNFRTAQKAFYNELTDIIFGNYMKMLEQFLSDSQEVVR